MNKTLKGFLGFLGGLTGGNNNVPDIPLPMEVEAQKPVKKATTKKATPAKKAAPKKKEQ